MTSFYNFEKHYQHSDLFYEKPLHSHLFVTIYYQKYLLNFAFLYHFIYFINVHTIPIQFKFKIDSLSHFNKIFQLLNF